MKLLRSRLPGVLVLEPVTRHDSRGFFRELHRESGLLEAELDVKFVQENHSRSSRGVIRGLHVQVGEGQGKLVRCVRGAIMDVVVDVRPDSPTFAQWESFILDDETGRSVFCPVGYAHGFAVISDLADVIYMCTSYYAPDLERAIAHNDPDIGIKWPQQEQIMSARDRAARPLREVIGSIDFNPPA